MGRLATKHQNQQTIEYRDFSGGMNTSNAEEQIAANELARAINVELDKPTGVLRTCAGTVTLLEANKTFTDFAYDSIGGKFVICASDRKVYSWSEGGTLTEVGTLTGTVSPAFAVWEDGLVIASGGKLQYFYGGTLHTIDTSPAVCNGVFVKDGRIWVYYNDKLHACAVGDEEAWEVPAGSDSSVDSESQWLDIGYKDGGEIVGVTNLSSDTLIFKGNGHAYRLSGKYPDWSLAEISRDVQCRGFRACVSLVNEALVLGESALQAVTTTQDYGNMRADEISDKVRQEIIAMPQETKLRFLPANNQLWFITGAARFLFLDVKNGAYFERQFNGAVKDVLAVGDTIYLLKTGKLQRLDATAEYDEDKLMSWYWRGRAMVSNNEYLVKRIRIDLTPISHHRSECDFWVGRVKLGAVFPQKYSAVWGDTRYVWGNTQYVYEGYSEDIYNTDETDPDEEAGMSMYRTDARCVERLRSITVKSKGGGGQCLFNGVNFEVAEV